MKLETNVKLLAFYDFEWSAKQYQEYLEIDGAACWCDKEVTVIGMEIQEEFLIDRVVTRFQSYNLSRNAETSEEFWKELRAKYVKLRMRLEGFTIDRESKSVYLRGPGATLKYLIEVGFEITGCSGFGSIAVELEMR